MASPIAPPGIRVAAKDCELYGLRVPKGTSLLGVELQCYRTNRGEDKGGFGALEHFKRAWRMAWPGFAWNDWVELLLWAWCDYKLIRVIGHTRASKTYGTAHVAYLDWCAAPTQTMTSLTTVTFDGLKIRMWADLMAAVESAAFACPGLIRTSSNEMKIIHGDKDARALDKFIIEGFATSRTADSAGRIQGKHALRRRVVLDEAQELPDIIYRALANAMSAPDFHGILLANPVDKMTEFGGMCEPANGWASMHDSDLFWTTKDGGICLHFDGLQSPNIKAGKTIFPFLIRQDYIDEIRANYGEDSLEWWMYVRGMFPPDGIVARVFPDVIIDRMLPEATFDFPPVKCASLDPAFEWDDCALGFAEYGKKRNGDTALNCKKSEKVQTKSGPGFEPKDYQIAHYVMKRCQEEGVTPDNFIMDKTGGGRGVFAILQKEWSYDIHGVEYGGAPTDRMLKRGETDKCEDLFMYFVTELYFRLRAFAEEGLVGGLGNFDKKTKEDLGARRYTVRKSGEKSRQVIESKADVKKRLGRSPDFGDMATQFGELLARKGILAGNTRTQAMRTKWAKAKAAAIKAGRALNEATEFAH